MRSQQLGFVADCGLPAVALRITVVMMVAVVFVVDAAVKSGACTESGELVTCVDPRWSEGNIYVANQCLQGGAGPGACYVRGVCAAWCANIGFGQCVGYTLYSGTRSTTYPDLTVVVDIGFSSMTCIKSPIAPLLTPAPWHALTLTTLSAVRAASCVASTTVQHAVTCRGITWSSGLPVGTCYTVYNNVNIGFICDRGAQSIVCAALGYGSIISMARSTAAVSQYANGDSCNAACKIIDSLTCAVLSLQPMVNVTRTRSPQTSTRTGSPANATRSRSGSNVSTSISASWGDTRTPSPAAPHFRTLTILERLHRATPTKVPGRPSVTRILPTPLPKTRTIVWAPINATTDSPHFVTTASPPARSPSSGIDPTVVNVVVKTAYGSSVVAGALSPTFANKPGVASRLSQVFECPLLRASNDNGEFPVPDQTALIPAVPEMLSTDNASVAASMLASTLCFGVLTWLLNLAAASRQSQRSEQS